MLLRSSLRVVIPLLWSRVAAAGHADAGVQVFAGLLLSS